MSDNRIERSICQAIEIMTNQKVAQADFDKTKKVTIQKVVDATSGKYLVKHQDSVFTAWSIGTSIDYSVGDLVIVLSPNGDTTATQIILGSASPTAKQYSIKNRNKINYNVIGPNAITMTTDRIELKSYENEEKVIFSSDPQKSGNNVVNVNQQSLRNYVREGNAAVVSCSLETNLDTAQTGGIYGLQIDYLYGGDILTTTQVFQLDSRSLEGYPYGKRAATKVVKPIVGIDPEKFISVLEIRAFATDFLQEEDKQPDIFISNLSITGAQVFQLDTEDNYLLNIDYSTNGNRLNQNVKEALLKALIKIDGKEMTSIQNVDYYWFRQNASILIGNERYSSLAGAGWESIMSLQGPAAARKTAPLKGNNTYIISSVEDKYNKQDFAYQALAVQKVNKFKCIAQFDGLTISGEVFIYNDNISGDIKIVSSDKLANGENRTEYRMGVGSPTLTCEVDESLGYNLFYTWIDTPYGKIAKQVDIQGKTYENYPVKNITKNTTISCAVKNYQQAYLGTASITLTNVNQLAETYGLVIKNGTQAFKYDENGISPCHPAKQNPLEIQPLSFILTDPQGMQISYQQIINKDGYVEWYVPKANSNTLLLANQEGSPSQGTDKAAAANFDVYKNLQQLHFAIVDTYKENNYLNYIKLNIYYKDLILTAYTNFTFAKNGDPGTNGTSYLAKIVPQGDTTDRIYGVRNQNRSNLGFFNDSGKSVNQLSNILYYNNQALPGQSTSWSCPIKRQDKAWVSCNSDGVLSGNSNSIETPVNIIRGTVAIQQDLKIYSQFPVNYNYMYAAAFDGNTLKYRFKIEPKTGFKYVKYSEDGTLPSYDNSLPFKVFLEQLVGNTYTKYTSEYQCSWTVLGNLKNVSSDWTVNNTCTIEPKDTFDGSDLTSAIKVFFKVGDTQLGFLHIPIYMYINRYNHAALNDWDGNSIDLGENSGVILAPQIGAGKKNEDNTFTGVFMGEVKNGSQDDIGLFGYNSGQRSIFLDAETGKAEFGVNNKGRIVIDPRNNKAEIYSGNYSTSGSSVGGMKIDFTTPQIRFGTGNFIVNENGYLTAKGGGSIAGWNINDNILSSGNVSLNSDPNASYTINANGKFTVTPAGYLTATSGKIAGWNIDANNLTDGNVGLGSRNIVANHFGSHSSFVARIWGGSSGSQNFAVSNDGKLYAKSADISGKMTATSGKIGGWTINSTTLTAGNLKLDSGGSITGGSSSNAGWGINANGSAYFNNAAIGGITVGSTGMSGTGWYIKPGEAHFTGLVINNNGITTSNNGDISGGGGSWGSGGMTLPTNTYSTPGDFGIPAKEGGELSDKQNIKDLLKRKSCYDIADELANPVSTPHGTRMKTAMTEKVANDINTGSTSIKAAITAKVAADINSASDNAVKTAVETKANSAENNAKSYADNTTKPAAINEAKASLKAQPGGSGAAWQSIQYVKEVALKNNTLDLTYGKITVLATAQTTHK